MPVYQIKIGEQSYRVEVPQPYKRPVRAIVDGVAFDVIVDTSPMPGATPAAPPVVAPIAPSGLAAPVAAGVPGQVTAPLPGVVLSVDVKVGDTVKYGDQLCVLEAMKMNNPIRATSAGKVTQVFINVGQQVQHSEALFKIE